jgi:tetratricopeptide (TPR) repeat protein
MRKQKVALSFIGIIGACVLCLAILAAYQVPAVNERLSWRLEGLAARVRRVLNPPEQVVFVPGSTSQPGLVETLAGEELQGPEVTMIPGASATPVPDLPTPSSTLAPTPSPTPTLLPGAKLLSGIVHEYQQFNNCGPANLAMALSYWGWQGDQRDTRAYLRPNLKVDDKNVNPSEMVTFVEQFAGMRAVARVGGDLDLLRGLVAAGFPVLIEAGHHPADDWWMGHYLVVSGYDDARRIFIVQDSLTNPDLPMSYEELALHWWRDFNYVYIVIYPAEREEEVLRILGPRADESQSFQIASQKASEEIPVLEGRDLFFAWFNLGSSQVGLADYAGAAQAFDKAFEIYQTLSEDMRPYRLMWYVNGPYVAYYNTGRYQDVVSLANITFSWVGQPVLEESYYWRGMASLALGEQNNAVSDLQKAAELNPNYAPPRAELLQLGVALP